MRPNVDDFEDIEEARPETNSRVMSWMVLAVAVGGFAALAYYAYNSGGNAGQDSGDVPVIEADATPIKEAPADPGGEQFANKDKTIYDVISNDGKPGVEKLMPDPERPVIAANVEDSEDNEPVADPAAPAAAPAASAEAKPITNGAKLTTTTYVSEEQSKKVETSAVTPANPPTPEPAKPAEKPVAEKSFDRPQIVNEKTITGKANPAAEKNPVAETLKPAPTKPVETPKEAAAEKPAKAEPAPSASAGGNFKVQLGAYKSEAEAEASWKKIAAKFPGVVAGAPVILKADVKGTTYYRLRAGSYASMDEAKATCAKLAGQACMGVK
jgi:hypothetical protein